MTDLEEIRGWVLYDGDCVLCIGLARRFTPLLRRRGFVMAPLPSGTQIDVRSSWEAGSNDNKHGITLD